MSATFCNAVLEVLESVSTVLEVVLVLMQLVTACIGCPGCRLVCLLLFIHHIKLQVPPSSGLTQCTRSTSSLLSRSLISMTLYIHTNYKLHVFTIKLNKLQLCIQDEKHRCAAQPKSKSDRLLVHLLHTVKRLASPNRTHGTNQECWAFCL